MFKNQNKATLQNLTNSKLQQTLQQPLLEKYSKEWQYQHSTRFQKWNTSQLPLTTVPSKQQHYGSSSSSSCCSQPCCCGPSLTVTLLPSPSWCLARGFLHRLVKVYFSLPATFQFFPNCHFYSDLNPPLSKGSFSQPQSSLTQTRVSQDIDKVTADV